MKNVSFSLSLFLNTLKSFDSLTKYIFKISRQLLFRKPKPTSMIKWSHLAITGDLQPRIKLDPIANRWGKKDKAKTDNSLEREGGK